MKILLQATETTGSTIINPNRLFTVVVLGNIANNNNVNLQIQNPSDDSWVNFRSFNNNNRYREIPGGFIYRMSATVAGLVAIAEYADLSIESLKNEL